MDNPKVVHSPKTATGSPVAEKPGLIKATAAQVKEAIIRLRGSVLPE